MHFLSYSCKKYDKLYVTFTYHKENPMKLLIVDDEELTRTGLISSIDWASLGIDEIIQADDGIHGLEKARLYSPEIILCDVRMPRMDGITMLERLEKLLPDSVPVFMSGYSDKEYLKAAIRLKAVSYIEKPLNPAEVSLAVREAADLYIQKRHSRRGEALKSMETSSRLALLLTLPSLPDIQTARRLSAELGFTMNSSTFFISFIIRMDTFPELSSLEHFYQELSDFLDKRKLCFIYTDKKRQNLLGFLFGQTEPSSRCLKEIGNFIGQRLSGMGKYSMVLGETVCGMAKAYQSYASAVILLQSSFFFPENTLLTHDKLNPLLTPLRLPLRLRKANLKMPFLLNFRILPLLSWISFRNILPKIQRFSRIL